MWLIKVCVCYAFLFLSLVHANGWVLTVDNGKTFFQASLNSIVLLNHSEEVPAVYIGAGTTVFKELHGNFDIEDTIERRIPLDVIEKYEDNQIELTTKSDNSLKIYLTFGATPGEDGFVELKISELPAGYDRIWLRFLAFEDEYVLGGGEQYTYLNMRGRKFPIWTREQGVGRNRSSLVTFQADATGDAGGDYYTTYYGEPTFFSSRGYMLHSTATYYTILDFTNTNFHELEVHGSVRTLKFMGRDSGQTIAQLSQAYAKSHGLMPALPEWMYNGAIVGLQGGTDRMNELLTKIESNGVKVSAVWIQDWAGKIRTSFGKRVFWNWEWNPDFYPGLDTEIPKLKARGIRVLTYINPYLNIEGPLFKEADALGYFVKNSTGQTYIADFGEFYCGTLDLTYPDAVAWYKRRIIKRAIDLGISGWMADFSEYLMVDNAKFHSGQSALELHNQWPLLWGKLNREAVEEAGKLGDNVFWMRAGYAGLSNYTTLFWAGDQNVDYTLSDGFPSTIPAALSVGLQGIGMTHYDIGLYTSMFGMIRTKDLFLRSAESAVFTAAMRTHEGNRPSENWQLYSDEDTMKQFARLVDVRQELVSYLKEAVQAYTDTGVPLQRALFYSFPDDTRSWEEQYQYMLGDDLLVAPVYQANVTTWSCYLPPGSWTHLWSGKEYSGHADVTVPAPVGQPPVFYKTGSAYPWNKLNIPLVPPPPPETSADGTKTEL